MRKALALIAVLAAMAPLSAGAQQANRNGLQPQPATITTPAAAAQTNVYSSGMTSEMWFYNERMRRHDDPQLIIQRRAQQRSAERRLRIETRKWYGYSALRPRANSTPEYGPYAAQWIGNGYRRSDWVIPQSTRRRYTASRARLRVR